MKMHNNVGIAVDINFRVLKSGRSAFIWLLDVQNFAAILHIPSSILSVVGEMHSGRVCSLGFHNIKLIEL